MQDLKLIRITKEPVSSVRQYLKKMRQNASSVPSLDEKTEMVE